MRSELAVGDQITTIGGIVGTICTVKEDTIVIETSSDRVRIEFTKWAVSSKGTQTMEDATATSNFWTRIWMKQPPGHWPGGCLSVRDIPAGRTNIEWMGIKSERRCLMPKREKSRARSWSAMEWGSCWEAAGPGRVPDVPAGSIGGHLRRICWGWI